MTIRASPLVFIITIFLCFISNLFSRQAGLASAECPLASPKPIVFPLANCSIQPNENYQDLLTSWGLEIQAGSQYFCVVPTFVSNNTILFDTYICTTDDTSTLAQCTSRRGGLFNFGDPISVYSNVSVQKLVPDPSYDSFDPAVTHAINTTLNFPSDISFSNFTFAVASQGENSNAGYFGIGTDSTVLKSFVSAGLSTNTVRLFARSQSNVAPRAGHIAFGGYDNSLLMGPWANFTMSNTTIEGSRNCALSVTVSNLTFRRPGMHDVELLEGLILPTCVEPLVISG